MERGTGRRGVGGKRTAARLRRAAGGTALVLAFGAAPLASQEMPGPEVSAFAGAFRYDHHGEGTTAFGALRFRLPLGRRILVEPSVAHAAWTADSARVSPGSSLDVRLFLVEFQVQGQLPLGRFRPYAGLGMGGAVDLRDHRGTDDFLVSTFSAAGGVAVDVGERWSLRGEVRARGLDELEDRAVELGFGASVLF